VGGALAKRVRLLMENLASFSRASKCGSFIFGSNLLTPSQKISGTDVMIF
jgi:hypothetical protein